MLPSNPQLTKLRLIAKRKENALHREEKNVYAIRRDYEKSWLEYVRACKAEGYCAACEELLDKCECIITATPQKRIIEDTFLDKVSI